MKVLIICTGSRGDAEPFAALAARLLQTADDDVDENDINNNSVDFFIQPELKSLAPIHENLTIHELPYTQFDFYKYTDTNKVANHKNERVRFVGIVAEIIAALCLPCWVSVYNIAKECDVMVTSALSRSLCFAMSQKLGIPTVLVHLQSLVPTNLFPHYSSVDDCVEAILNLNGNNGEPLATVSEGDEYSNMYWMFERYQLEFTQEALDEMYDRMDLKPRMDFETVQRMLSGNDDRVIIANCMNDGLVPQVTDAGPGVHQIGPLADHYVPVDFEPPGGLVSFLSSDNHPAARPICIGFGSMPYSQVSLILDALREVDRKAVWVGNALELSLLPTNDNNREWVKTNVCHVSSIPYAWLLPQCQMMICHGGAGVVNATLRAGIPIVISPYMGDQFFHAELCRAKGLGTRAGQSLGKATKEDFVMAIHEATSCTSVAREFGEMSRSKSTGVDNLVALMDSIVNLNN